MERRPYFLLGDVLACGVTGAAAGLAAVGMVAQSWNMLAAMVVGMIIGMVLALFLGLALFFWLFGFEVLIPVMLTGMLAGMALGMAEAVTGLEWSGGAVAGALIGWGTLLATYLINARLTGKVSEWTS